MLLFPLLMERQHVLGKEALDGTAVVLVLGTEQVAGDQVVHGRVLGEKVSACAGAMRPGGRKRARHWRWLPA
ncbi:hypothetical protein D3C85_1662240 [compost metagenome]